MNVQEVGTLKQVKVNAPDNRDRPPVDILSTSESDFSSDMGLRSRASRSASSERSSRETRHKSQSAKSRSPFRQKSRSPKSSSAGLLQGPDERLARIANPQQTKDRLTFSAGSSSEPDYSEDLSEDSFDLSSDSSLGPLPLSSSGLRGGPGIRAPGSFGDAGNSAASSEEEIDPDKLLGRLDYFRAQGHYDGPQYSRDADPSLLKHAVKRAEHNSHLRTGSALSKKVFVGLIGGFEMLNAQVLKDVLPVTLELDGWSNQVETDIADFEDVLLRVWEKYFQQMGMDQPLVELAILVAMSGFSFHMGRSMAKQFEMPGTGFRPQAPVSEGAQRTTQFQRPADEPRDPGLSFAGGMPDFGNLMGNFNMPNIPLDSSESSSDTHTVEDEILRQSVRTVPKTVPKAKTTKIPKTPAKKTVPKATSKTVPKVKAIDL